MGEKPAMIRDEPFKGAEGGKEPCDTCDTAEPWCRYWNLTDHMMCCKDCSHLRPPVKEGR